MNLSYNCRYTEDCKQDGTRESRVFIQKDESGKNIARMDWRGKSLETGRIMRIL